MKLFVSVGTQFPFDRLVRTIDLWAGQRPDAEVFAQVGPSSYAAQHIECAPFISAGECRRRAEEADAVIAHAGMGSIITALELGKPIIVMPRRADLDEHRNDHQMATARSLLAMGMVIVAFDESHLREKLDHLDHLVGGARRDVKRHASARLLATLREFARSGAYRPAQRAGGEEAYPSSIPEVPHAYLAPPANDFPAFADQPTPG